jgi:hypothetical protein
MFHAGTLRLLGGSMSQSSFSPDEAGYGTLEKRWLVWFEMLGMAAVVLSLIFVGLQMEQQRNLTRATLGARGMEVYSRVTQTLSDPDVALAWAKMLERPEDLSTAEMVQVNTVLVMVKNSFMRECYLKDMGVFDECDYVLRDQARNFFGSSYAQSWWRLNKPPNGYELEKPLDTAISSLDIDSNLRMLEEVKQGARYSAPE